MQVNLKKGVPPDSINETCTAGAGSLLVEFGILSRLIGDSTFEWVARRAVKALWNLRSNETGLLGKWLHFLICFRVHSDCRQKWPEFDFFVFCLYVRQIFFFL